MCGIVYVKNLVGKEPVNSLIRTLYENQKERGQQGFGFIGLKAKQMGVYRAVNERGILNYLRERQYDEIILHHRLPTSTQNTLKSTHPFVMEMNGRRYYFMHNGIIQNARELKEKHSKMGIRYSSEEGTDFNDSEALAWEFCLWLNHQKQEVEASGTAAFLCLEVDKGSNRARKLYFYRNDGAPLRGYRDSRMLLLASTGNYAMLKANWLCFWDYERKEIRRHSPLVIQRPSLFSFDDCDYCYPDDELAAEEELAALEQERDYLVSVGEYDKAQAIDEDIEDLRAWLKERRDNGWSGL